MATSDNKMADTDEKIFIGKGEQPAWLTLDSTDHTPGRSRAGYFFIKLNVYTTSAAVIGVPSFHLTFLRMVNVSELLPAPHCQEVASMGVVLPFCSALT